MTTPNEPGLGIVSEHLALETLAMELQAVPGGTTSRVEAVVRILSPYAELDILLHEGDEIVASDIDGFEVLEALKHSYCDVPRRLGDVV